MESVTSHNLYPLPLSQTVTLSQTPGLPPLERDILYGRLHVGTVTGQYVTHDLITSPCYELMSCDL